jgi:hypothetical protein
MQFRYKGKLYPIAKSDGPERIEQEWWLADGLYRDYYCVEDEKRRPILVVPFGAVCKPGNPNGFYTDFSHDGLYRITSHEQFQLPARWLPSRGTRGCSAALLGYDQIAIADHNTLGGCGACACGRQEKARITAHHVGCRLELLDGPPLCWLIQPTRRPTRGCRDCSPPETWPCRERTVPPLQNRRITNMPRACKLIAIAPSFARRSPSILIRRLRHRSLSAIPGPTGNLALHLGIKPILPGQRQQAHAPHWATFTGAGHKALAATNDVHYHNARAAGNCRMY